MGNNYLYKILEELLKNGNWRAAILIYNRIIEMDRGNISAYFSRGIAKDKLGNIAEAIKDFDRVVELDPERADIYYARGISKYAIGNVLEAIKDFDRSIELNSHDGRAYYNRGTAKHALGDKEGAIKDYNQVIELEPKNKSAYVNRGVAKYDLNDNTEAIKDFDLAIELNPNDIGAYYNRGLAKSGLNNQEGAMKDYNQAINLDPHFVRAYLNRGLIKSNIGLIREATFDFYRTISLYPSPPPTVHKELLSHFHYVYLSPFQVKNLLTNRPEIHYTNYYTLITENTHQCHPLNTWLAWLDIQYPTPNKNADWLRALIHFHMGDPITTFGILDDLEDGGKVNFAQQYFFLQSADLIQHDERAAIREYALEAALAFSENDDEDDNQIYWAARLLTYCDEPLAALDCLKKGLAGELYFYLNRSEAYEAAGLSGYRSLDLAKQTIDATDIGPEEVLQRREILSKGQLKDWLWYMEMAIQFYDLEELITREFGTGKTYSRFWEIWDTSELETALLEHRKAELEARLQALFDKKLAEHYAGASPDEGRFKQKNRGVWRTFTELKQSEELVYEISELIFEARLPREILADLVEYFYLTGQLPANEILYLYFYLSVCKKTGPPPAALQEGMQETGKVWVENLLKGLVEKVLIPGVAYHYTDAMAAGSALAFTTLARQFLEKGFESTNQPYEVFKKDFREFILDKMERVGETAFFQEYPLSNFEDFKK